MSNKAIEHFLCFEMNDLKTKPTMMTVAFSNKKEQICSETRVPQFHTLSNEVPPPSYLKMQLSS